MTLTQTDTMLQISVAQIAFGGLKSFSECNKESQQIDLGGLKAFQSAKSAAKNNLGGLKSFQSASSVATKMPLVALMS